MVAKISVKNALMANFYYNENKVEQGVAECIMAANYPLDLERMMQAGRLKTLTKLAARNPSIKVNSVHISLNFDPSEQLSKEQFQEIAKEYMDRIGFGAQPYLVYQHMDAGHPHIHILSVKVGLDGKSIDTHNIGIRKSEPARKELEEKYGLVRAQSRHNQYILKSAFAQKIQYGKTESRRAIGNVLDAVLTSYNYTSLPELNAVLKFYNVMADRCKESSRVYQNNGLLYRILDDKGNAVGVPIKASAFYNKPTLRFLEERFTVNALKRQPMKGRVKSVIDLYFLNKKGTSLQGFIAALKREGVDTVIRGNDKGDRYGITYVDHKSKAVFNGSDLGKPYSIKGILERFDREPARAKMALANAPASKGPITKQDIPATTGEKDILELLTQAEHAPTSTPYELKGRKKKRRRISKN